MTELLAEREIDAQIAKQIMGYEVAKVTQHLGWHLNPDGSHDKELTREEWELRKNGNPIMVHGELMHGYFPCPVPNYSTNIAAAWAVIEEMQRRGFVCSLDMNFEHEWECRFIHEDESWPIYEAYAKTAPLVICNAVLKMTGVAEIL